MFHGSFHAHRDCIGSRGASILNLELPWWFEPRNPLGRVSNPDEIATCAEQSTADALSLLLTAAVPLAATATDWPHELAKAINSDPGLCLSDWAESRGLSASQLSRGFTQVFGVPAPRYRAQSRARKAWRRIVANDLPLVDVAMNADFADQPHMNRAVRQLSGLTPGCWRAQIRSRLPTSALRN